MPQSPSYYCYWGKAERGGAEHHLLVYHALDVAALGCTLIARDPGLAQRLSHQSGLTIEQLRLWLPRFLALHDLGKFAATFQNLRPDLIEQLEGPKGRPGYTTRHDTLGYALWQGELGEALIAAGWLGTPSEDPLDFVDLCEPWARAITGHHGKPPHEDRNFAYESHFGRDNREAAKAFALDLDKLWPRPEPLTDLDPRPHTRFSWTLAGLCTLADWLGSNRDYFAFNATPMALADYWHHHALPAAARALEAAAIDPIDSAATLSAQALFDFIDQPTPLQREAAAQTPDAAPRLYLIEEVTGAGKTEAAFILLNRLLAAGAAHGAYIALPTTATADALYRRTASVYRRLFDPNSAPNLILAHASRGLNRDFRASLSRVAPGQTTLGQEDESSATCSAWLGDHHQAALFAHLGVGTIDQALLAILAAKYQPLRLFGLHHKVLIVDEVHAADAYMRGLLTTLLELHARQGGSAILLSATLAKQQRQQLIDAYRRGLDQPSSSEPSSAYPLLTEVDASGLRETPVDARPELTRTLRHAQFHHESDVLDWVVERSQAGECVAWIRNSVGDALEAYTALAERLPAEHLTLFHARFAMADRLKIEAQVLDTFGSLSRSTQRRGQVLIATQVVEQSLDLDFDQLVTDLAPIDLLLQRAGRLQRHRRNAEGNPTEDEARPAPCLHLLAPAWHAEADADWYARLLPRAAYVYPDHGQLWLTADYLAHHPILAIPAAMRPAIEAVYAPEVQTRIPDGLRRHSQQAEGGRKAAKVLANFNTITPERGYRRDFPWEDEHSTPTRLGEPTRVLRLTRWDGSQLIPWSSDPDNPWPLSELRLRASQLVQILYPNSEVSQAVEALQASWHRLDKEKLLVVLEPHEGEWRAQGVNARGEQVELRYDTSRGLIL